MKTVERWFGILGLVACGGLFAMGVVATCVGCAQPIESIQVLMQGDDVHRVVAVSQDGEMVTLIAVERPRRVEILRRNGQRLILEGTP